MNFLIILIFCATMKINNLSDIFPNIKENYFALNFDSIKIVDIQNIVSSIHSKEINSNMSFITKCYDDIVIDYNFVDERLDLIKIEPRTKYIIADDISIKSYISNLSLLKYELSILLNKLDSVSSCEIYILDISNEFIAKMQGYEQLNPTVYRYKFNKNVIDVVYTEKEIDNKDICNLYVNIYNEKSAMLEEFSKKIKKIENNNE